MEEKYVVYVGTYTHENSIGIHLYDLDAKSGEMKERKVVLHILPIPENHYRRMADSYIPLQMKAWKHFTFCRMETLSQ